MSLEKPSEWEKETAKASWEIEATHRRDGYGDGDGDGDAADEKSRQRAEKMSNYFRENHRKKDEKWKEKQFFIR